MTEHQEPMPEGKEAPPPGTRAMGLVRWLIVLLMATIAATSVLSFVGASAHSEAEKAMYHCPMHPGVVQDHPGDCPICGMTLVLRTHSDAGASGASTTAGAPSAGGAYVCPMHPDQSSNDPNARCPICKMRLEPRPKASASGSAPGSAAAAPMTTTVPGLVPVDLSPERIQLVGLRTALATKEKLSDALTIVGSIAAPEQGVAKVHARTTGWIEELLVTRTGDKVARGQAVAMVYSPEILAAQNEYLKVRTWSVGGDDAGPLAGLDVDARRRLDLVGMSAGEISQLEKTGVARKYVIVSSPVAGFVTRKSAFKGQYFQPGTELFEIADLSTVWVLADVPEREIGRVKLEQHARLKLLSYANETFEGAVKFIYPMMNAATRTLRVRLVLPNKEGRLFPGMYGDVTIDLPAADAIVVPSSAVVDTGDVQYVFLARGGGRFEPRRVKVGARTGDKVQILDGVQEGEAVVTTGNFLIDSESRLSVALQSAAAKSAPAGHDHGK